MTEEEIIKNLESGGYDKVWIYDAEPGEVDEEHTHDFDTKLKILRGSIRIKVLDGGSITDYSLKSGDDIGIKRKQIHSAIVGSDGCRYVVAEKH